MSKYHLSDVIRRPLVSEKSMSLLDDGGSKVGFEVARWANKVHIRRAVEQLYDVEVTSVNTLIVRGKVKRQGRFIGKRKNWKKAIVSLAEGYSIDFLANVGGDQV